MAKFFVCEPGSMGGINIVFVTDTYQLAMTWIGKNGKGRDLSVYQLVFEA